MTQDKQETKGKKAHGSMWVTLGNVNVKLPH